MSKTLKTSTDLEKIIMAKVKSNEIAMKPKWYFVVGSLIAIAGLVGLSILAVFLTNLTFFLLFRHGPMVQWRLQQLVTSFPLWIPILAVLGIVMGIWILRKYEFSYKKNFGLIIIGFIFSVIIAAIVIDQLGLNDIWSHQGPMRQFYQQVEGKNPTLQRGAGQGKGQLQNRFYQQGQ